MTIKTIQQGTNLTTMVAAYNREFNAKFTVAEIAKANGIKNPDKIQAGGKLIFPDKFEVNAKQETIRNAEGGKTQRSGVKETVNVSMGPSAPVTTTPGQLSTQVQSRPLEKLPEAPKSNAAKTEQPITTTPGQISTQVQSRPLEKLPEPPAKTSLSLNEFLAANKGQKLSVDSLRRGGVNAAPSDLNGDGVVSGQKELTSLFATAEKADSNKDKTVADLTNTTVAKNFERIGSAQRLSASPYSQLDLQRVEITLKEGSADRIGTVNPESAKQLGLSPGSTELMVSMPVDESRGLGNRNNFVTIYRDAKSGQYFKEYSNDADGKNTPMVPLTAKEKELVRNLDASRLGGSGPNQQAMMNELFSFDGDL